MKRILRNLFTGLFMIGAGISLVSAQKIDATSKKILDEVITNYNSKKNTYFKFAFGSGTNGTVNKTENGSFYSAGDKYHLNVIGNEQIFDGNKIYNINEEDKEITIAKPNATEAMFSPMNYLKTYRKDYNAAYVGKKIINGVNTDFIKLTPVKSNGLKEVLLFIDSANKKMVKLEQHGTNKDVAIISIKEYKENQKLDSKMFTFDKSKYKNYLITEL